MRLFGMRTIGLLVLLLAVLALGVACSSSEEPAADGPVSAETPDAVSSTETYTAPVDSVEILIMESFPVQINVIAAGTLPDGCSTIDPDVEQTRSDTTYTVTLNAVRPADVVCTAEAVAFQEIIGLDVVDLPAGSYTVNVNGVTAGFTLDVDNSVQQPPTPEPTPEPVADPTATPASEVEANDPGTGVIIGDLWHDLCTVTPANGDTPAAGGEGCVPAGDSFLADGAKTEDEPALEGIVVSLYSGACPGVQQLATTETDANGTYTFAQLNGGTYCVTIDVDEEPNTTILLPGAWTTTYDNAQTGSATVELAAGGSVVDLDFGWDYELLPEADVVVNDPNCIDVVSFGADVTIPDDSPFEPGTEFVKTWALINAGSCNWGAGYELAFVGGDQMGAADAVPLEGVTRSGEVGNVSVPFIAPEETGFYRSEWQLRTPEGELLGLDSRPAEVLWTQIEVVEEGTLASITGFMWEDVCDQSMYTFGDEALPPGCTLNSNGTVRGDSVYDSAEPVMPGITITLGRGECGTAETITVDVTDEQGVYRFDGLVPDTYCVFVDVIEEANFPLLWPGTFTFPAPGKAGTTVVVEAGDAISNINFGWDFADDAEESAEDG